MSRTNKYTARSVYRSGNYTTVTYWKGKRLTRKIRESRRVTQKTLIPGTTENCAIYHRDFWFAWGKVFLIVYLAWVFLLQVQIAMTNTVQIVHAATYSASMVSPVPSIPSVKESPKPLASYFPFVFTPRPTPKLTTPLPSDTPTPEPTQIETPKPDIAAPVVRAVKKIQGFIYGVKTGNYYEDYIFQHESGYILNRVNKEGCYGLGQDCNNRLASVCPNWRTDQACQLRYWESYMLNRYGSWINAYNFWNRTDCRPFCNHWW